MLEILKSKLQNYENNIKVTRNQNNIEDLCEEIQSAYDNGEITEEDVYELMKISDFEIDM